ncbi:hypothetical protein Glove_99g368 [Diversispora epigaea]|uniref:Uncharacterized protein n=1 Tax=Diversispora epigaea TaxID=1348612 RepID=A0A397J4B9_9GLOM|nr:hypothetical protein Glove_99g368 [Diversispora epigaea]
MGLMRLTYNTIIDYLQSRQFLIVHVDKNKNKYKMINFPKIQFLRTVIYLKLKVNENIPNNIIVDEAIKNFNSKDNNTRLKFKTKKDLKDLKALHFETKRKTTVGHQKRSIMIASSHTLEKLEKLTNGSFHRQQGTSLRTRFLRERRRRKVLRECLLYHVIV